MAARRATALAVALFVFGFGEELWFRYLPEYLRVLGVSAFGLGLFGTLKDFLDAAYAFPGGAISDRLGSRRALLLFGGLTTAGLVLLWSFPSAAGVFAGLVLVMLTPVGHVFDQDGLDRHGIDACLVKPVRHSRLATTLADAWARRRAADVTIDEAAAAVPHAENVEVPPGAGEFSAVNARVLVVEDNAVNQKVAVALLAKVGVRAEVAGDGQEAVERVRAGAYDLILMDCQMPRMNGYHASQEIRRREGTERVPIVAMTADVIDGSRERALQAGMDDFVSKPIDLAELTRALRTWLKKAG